jgi:Multiubiquitin
LYALSLTTQPEHSIWKTVKSVKITANWPTTVCKHDRKDNMKETMQGHDSPNEGKGPKFTVDIEGRLIEWDEKTISAEKIAELGGWDFSQGVMVIDADNVERQLQAGEIVELKPGMGFSKKVHFKRG